MKLLLEEELDQLHQWFNRVYPQWQLEVQTKKDKTGESYILIVHHVRHGATKIFLKEEYLLDLEMRKAIKEGALHRMQTSIMGEIG